MISQQIKHWQDLYPDVVAEQVGIEVINVYEEAIISRVAHSEQFRGQIPNSDIEAMRTDQALSMSLLGLITEDAMISPRIAGRLGLAKRRSTRGTEAI